MDFIAEARPTKIARYDLDIELKKILDDIEDVQGDYNSLYERLFNITTDMLGPNSKEIMDDLIALKDNESLLPREKFSKIEEKIKALQKESNLLYFEGGNFSEVFEEDEFENITKHTVTGDLNYVVEYIYSDPGEGILERSVTTYENKDQNEVVITKTYTYGSNGNIEGIQTVTTESGDEE